MFALVDVNSFYASCEMVFRPDLRGRPVVVLSNNDGCVIARNHEAKLLEIPMGAPYFKMKSQFERHQVAVFSSNYALYGDMSQRVMTLLEELSPAVYQYSIDEAFVNLSGIHRTEELEAFGRHVRSTLLQCTGLTVGVGIGPTKTLAKLANYAAKRWPKFEGVVDLFTSQAEETVGEGCRRRNLGVGRRMAKKLNDMGITTALELAEMPASLIRKHFSVVMERTVRELRGESCLEPEEYMPTKQQIISSRSFSQKVSEYGPMREAICSHAVRAAERLRAQHQYCRFVSVFLKTSPFAGNDVYYGNDAGTEIHIPTQDSRDIVAAAVKCWRLSGGRDTDIKSAV